MTIEMNSSLTPVQRGLMFCAAGLVLAVCLAHVVLFSVGDHQHWAGWISGGLRGERLEANTGGPSYGAFWALPGSFVAPLALIGLHVWGSALASRPVPRYYGWILLAWSLLNSWIMEPSGFPAGIVVSLLLIAAAKRRPPRPAANSATTPQRAG